MLIPLPAGQAARSSRRPPRNSVKPRAWSRELPAELPVSCPAQMPLFSADRGNSRPRPLPIALAQGRGHLPAMQSCGTDRGRTSKRYRPWVDATKTAVGRIWTTVMLGVGAAALAGLVVLFVARWN
jgi:hypothetical protein